MAKKADVTYRAVGDWDGVMRRLADLGPEIKAGCRSAQYVVGREILTRAKDHLRNQDLGWKKLSKSTIARKGHDVALLEYGTYYANIKLWQKELVVYTGVPIGVKQKNNTETALVASFHEFGAKGVPKRPLWKPVFTEMGGREGLRIKLSGGIKAYLEKKGYSVSWR